MRKILPLTALVLGLSSGVALADRHDHRGGDHRGSVSRDHRGSWRGGAAVVVRGGAGVRHGGVVVRDRGFRGGWHGGGRVVVHNRPHYVRRPIFVSRPVIRTHYYNYYRRPTILVENYAPMAGYYWVAGRWTWNGYEWLWQPGHYEPDPNYVDPYYDGYYQ